jgi:hypothetical protein
MARADKLQTLITSILGFLLFACGSATRVVVLQHPQTKQTVECRVNPMGPPNNTKQIEDCVTAYKKAGYAVVGDSE